MACDELGVMTDGVLDEGLHAMRFQPIVLEQELNALALGPAHTFVPVTRQALARFINDDAYALIMQRTNKLYGVVGRAVINYQYLYSFVGLAQRGR